MHTTHHSYDHPAAGIDFRYDCDADPHLIQPEREAAARRARIAQRAALEEIWHEVVEAHSTALH